jgi:5-methylthioadenosine/S-adenosylhomocysteine deaminase
MASGMVRGRAVITGVDDRGEPGVVDDGAVYYVDGVIVDVGRYADLAARYRPDDVIGSRDHLVMPGLVNGHHHVGVTPFQLGSPDHPLELWLAARVAARDVDPYLDTLYSAFEMIESGITTVQHLHGSRWGPVSAWPARAARVLEAYRDIGMRVSYAFMMRDQNHLVYGPNEEFVRTLPPDVGATTAAWLADIQLPFDDFARDLFEALYEACGRNQAERVRIWLAPANLHWCSDALLVRVKDLARRRGVGIHLHLLETVYQKLYARRRFGTSAVRHLDELGFLGPEVTLGHAVWVTEDDLDAIGHTATAVCHNPSSNLRLKSGIAPVNARLERGRRVAIGIDEAGINDDRDMLQELRVALRLHRGPGIARAAPTSAQIFRMATEHGAHATGYGGRLGALAPGRAADFAVVSLRNIAEPYLDAEVAILDALVHRGRSIDVETVVIGGEVVMRDRQFTRLEKQEILRALQTSLAAPLRPDEVERRRLARALLPHVRRFYETWPLEAGESYDPRNARA